MTIARIFRSMRQRSRVHVRNFQSVLLAALIACAAGPKCARGADNGIASSPPLGWSSWSALEQNIDENTIKTIAKIQASVLKPAGYTFVNVDGGWYLNPDMGIDSFGRWVADPTKFPNGMRALGDYIHELGLRFGIYVTPGIPKLAVMQNTAVEGTSYRASDIAITTKMEVTYLGGTMYSIDYGKPGSQDFINSWANLFASWGVDYIKLDAVRNSNVPDVQAWSRAISQSGRSIHLELANDLDPANAEIWRRYSNGWRISTDIESYNGTTLTSWDPVALRFALAPKWLGAAGPGGWNDLDSLEVGSARSGLTPDERRTMVTFWSLSASPLFIGDDLRQLDPFGIQLLTNAEVIGVNQNGVIAAPLNTAKNQQVWAALEPDGSYAVGLFNLDNSDASVEVHWLSLGIVGPANVRDLWASLDLGLFRGGFSAQIPPHGARLLRVTPSAPVLQVLASTATPSGGAFQSASTVGARGQRTRFVGPGGAITFPSVKVGCGGLYDLTINYVNGDNATRNAIMTVSGSSLQTLTFAGTGDWASNVTEQGIATNVLLAAGTNTIVLENGSGSAPDIIGITLQFQGSSGGRRTGSPDCVSRQPSAVTGPGSLSLAGGEQGNLF